MSAKVIAIGMDAGDPVLLERWMDGGLLPGLAALRREGAWGRPIDARLVRFLLVNLDRAVPDDELFDALWPGLDVAGEKLHEAPVRGRVQSIEFYALQTIPEIAR